MKSVPKCPKCKNTSISKINANSKFWACDICRLFSTSKQIFNPNNRLFKKAVEASETCWLIGYIIGKDFWIC